MHKFNNIEKGWKPSRQQIEETRDFVISCAAKGDMYDTGNASRISGKLAEIAALDLIEYWIDYVSGTYCDITAPDYTVYSVKDRSYDADMFLISSSGERVGVHIKCHFSRKEWKVNFQSWAFSKKDPCYRGKCGANDIFIFLKENQDGEFSLCWIGNVKNDLYNNNLFDEMKMSWKARESAVYNDRLEAVMASGSLYSASGDVLE